VGRDEASNRGADANLASKQSSLSEIEIAGEAGAWKRSEAGRMAMEAHRLFMAHRGRRSDLKQHNLDIVLHAKRTLQRQVRRENAKTALSKSLFILHNAQQLRPESYLICCSACARA